MLREIMRFLCSMEGKSVLVKNSGYMSCQTFIENLEYMLNYRILTIKDKNSDNFMVIDMKKIKEIKLDSNKMDLLIFINDEVETEISIVKI